jgi:hypothetical protein
MRGNFTEKIWHRCQRHSHHRSLVRSTHGWICRINDSKIGKNYRIGPCGTLFSGIQFFKVWKMIIKKLWLKFLSIVFCFTVRELILILVLILFQGMPSHVRLDPTDAEFVDVIHTDGKGIIFLGKWHYDFLLKLDVKTFLK